FAVSGLVTAWVTAPHLYSYYVGDDYGMGSYPNNSQGLLEDCVNILDPTLDFSLFDNNGDGYAEGIFLVHAGPGAEESGSTNDIWSHAWYQEVMTADGVSTGRYSTEPEEDLSGQLISIGVYCHEYGHVLGMPDLYDTNGGSEGVGTWCLMGSGSWGALPGNPERPTHMCAEMKRRLGWLTPIEVTGNLINLVIPPVETYPVCYKITNPLDEDENFLIENRAQIGFDSLTRGDGGLAIWHVDYNGWQADQTHRYVSLEQADGNSDLERDMGGGNADPRSNRGDAGDLFPGACRNHHFSFSTNPSSLSYDGITGIMTITNIEYALDSVKLDIHFNTDQPVFRIISYDVIDTLSGSGSANFNGDADLGEIVDVVLNLACDGVGAADLKGTLSTSDPRLSIVDGEADFGAVNHNTYIDNNASPFRIEVLSSNSDSAVTCNLHLDADGATLDIEFRLNINRQKILLVIDNNGSNWSDNLIEAMYHSGYSFDLFNTADGGTPTYNDLIMYHAILWTTASYFGRTSYGTSYGNCLTASELAVLTSYLNSAGRLGLYSQDYMRDVGYNTFNGTFLHINGAMQDYSAAATVGASGTFMDGFSGTSRASSFLDYTDDLLPGTGALEAVFNNPQGQTMMVCYPSAGPQPGLHASTFSSYGIERFEDSSLVQFLQTWLPWLLSNTNVDIPFPVSPKDNDTVFAFLPELRWTESNGADSYHVQLAIDANFTNIIKDTTVGAGLLQLTDTLAEGGYYWRVSAEATGDPETPFSPAAYFVRGHIDLYVCGDANSSGTVNLLDVTFLINYLYRGGPEPIPPQSGDANASGSLNILDVTYIINYLYRSGPEPLCP
ncbi:MAG: M6 family metalloprotease domain-containing protein, partial [Candidatus Zixiibacteriota bacterium]